MSKASLSLLDLAGVKPYQMKKDEEYMSEDQILHFRKILNAWHEQIVEEASRTVAHMQDEVTKFPRSRRPSNSGRGIQSRIT